MEENKQTVQTAFQQTPPDARQVVPFCKLNAHALSALDRTLGTGLTAGQFRWLQAYYTQTERRDPTVGELRLFAELDKLTRSAARRAAAGELYTDSAEMADVWADIMARRHALHPEDNTPCTVPDILTLTGQWMEHAGERKTPTDTGALRVLTDSSALSGGNPVHMGDCPVERMVLSGGNGLPVEGRLFFTRPPEKRRRPAQPGDLLVWVKHAPAEAVIPLCIPDRGEPVAADALLLTGTPLPLTILSLCGGARISLERLFPDKMLTSAANTVPSDTGFQADTSAQSLAGTMESQATVRDPRYNPKDSIVLSFCRLGTETAPAGPRADYLLRIRYTQAQTLQDICRAGGLTAVPIGEVREDGLLTLTQSEQTVVRARTQFVRFAAGSVYLSTFRLPVPKEPLVPGVRHLMAAPAPRARIDGHDLTPAGREAVALMQAGDPLYLPDAGVLTSTAACVLPTDGTAYPLARNTVLAALAALIARGIRRQEITLSVTLTCPGRPEETVLSAVCGLYRASAELCLPMPDAAFIRGDGTRLSVSAWAPVISSDSRLATRDLTGKPGRRLYLLFSESDTPDTAPDWADLRAMTSCLAQTHSHFTALYPVVSDGAAPLDLLQRWVADHPGAGVALDPARRQAVSTPRRLAFLAEYDGTNAEPPIGVEIGSFTDTPGLTFTATPEEAAASVMDDAPGPGTQEESGVANVPSPGTGVPPLAGGQTSAATPANKSLGSGHAKVAVLPLLHPEWESAIRDTATVLGKQGFRCLMVPLHTVPRVQETVFDEHGVVVSPASPILEVLEEDAVRLAEHISHADLAVLTMGAEEAAVLMANATIRQAMACLTDPAKAGPKTAGTPAYPLPRLLVIGGACSAMALAGFLPDTLAHGSLSTVPTAGLVVPVTFHDPGSTDGGPTHTDTLLRLCRCDLLAPAATVSPDACLMTVHCAPGRDVPDGYRGCDGAVLGFVNGLPDQAVFPLG